MRELLKRFQTADWYGDYYHHAYVEMYARLTPERKVAFFDICNHDTIVDSSSSYRTMEGAEAAYRRMKGVFSKEYPNVDHKEEKREIYYAICRDLITQDIKTRCVNCPFNDCIEDIKEMSDMKFDNEMETFSCRFQYGLNGERKIW